MSNHTPGPWYANKEGYIYRRPLSELHKYGGSIADDKPLAATWKGWYEEGETGYPVDANARLIAAAPEMYELLANLAAVCDSWDEDYENDEQRADAFWHMARIAKVLLLTKIEGGGDNG